MHPRFEDEGFSPCLRYLTAKADAKGVDLAELVNDMLKKDIEIIEMAR